MKFLRIAGSQIPCEKSGIGRRILLRSCHFLRVNLESRNVTVFRENAEALVNIGSLSMPQAHTVSVDPDTHLVCFPLQDLNGKPALRIMEASRVH
jgi:hypothetical protein